MNTLKLISDELYIFWEYCNKKYKLGSSKLNKDMIVNKSAKFIDEIDKLEKKIKLEHDTAKLDILSKKVKNLYDKLKGIRKESLKNGNEMSFGNIIWKVLRRTKYIEKIFKLKTQTYDKINSIK